MASDTRAKRARTGLADPPPALTAGSSTLQQDRDWTSLPSGPAGLIAERVLSRDVADYVRFRAVCATWRSCCVDPGAQGVADRRFHPRRWIMLPRAYSSSSGRCFLSVSTGECVHACILDLRSNYILGSTVGCLLVMCRKGINVVQLLNPLTGELTDLPGVDTMIDRIEWGMSTASSLRRSFVLHSAGIADDSTVALLYSFDDDQSDFGDHSNALAVAKPGEEQWTRFTLDYVYIYFMPIVLPYAGRLYCITHHRIMVVEAAAAEQQWPRLEPVPLVHYELEAGDSKMYPAYDDEGNLILAHRIMSGGQYSFDKYTTYQARFDTGSVVRMRGLGGQALFVSGGRSQSVPASVSSAPITADTIYVCDKKRVVAFVLIGGGRVSVPESFEENAIAGALWSYVCL